MTLASVPGIPAPLVGRERERAVLRQHRDAAISGHGSLVLVGGEAGIGKTALAETLCREATAQDALVLTGRCFDLAETPAYGPWLYLFERYPASADVPPPPAFAVPGTIGQVVSQSALFRQVLDFLKALTARQPTILLLDDLHWADQASLDLVRFLAQSVGTLPLVLLVTYRSDELTRRHPLYQLLPTLVRESGAARLDLRPLDDAAIRTLVAARYRLAEPDTDRLVAYLQVRAEGNAFFLGELLRALEEADALRFDGADWTLADLRHTGVPQLLRQVIDARLARLDEESQRLLAVAAVIGHEIPLSVWATVAEADEEALLTTVERALDARLLAELPGGERVQFAHALVREALYEGIPAIRRRRIHRQAGEILMAQSAPDPDAIGYHFHQAGDARAATWLFKAGEQALMIFADKAAAARLETALALLDVHEPQSAERGWVLNYAAGAYRYFDPSRAMNYATEALRIAEATGDRMLTLGTLRLRGWLYNDTGQMRAGLDDMFSVQALRGTFTDAELGAAQARWQFAIPGPLYDGAVIEYLAICGEFGQARPMGERFVAGLPNVESGTAGLSLEMGLSLGNCHFGLMLAYIYQGEPVRATRAAALARTCYSHVGWNRMLAHVARAELLNALTYLRDQPQKWRRLAAEWDAWYAELSLAGEASAPRLGLATVRAIEGNWEEARSIIASMPDDVPLPHRETAWLIVADIHRTCAEMGAAWSLLRLVLPNGPTAQLAANFRAQEPALRLGAALALDEGDLPTATSWLRAHDALLARSEAVAGRAENRTLWARYYRASEDTEHAYEHARHALDHATEPRQPLALLTAYRLLGELDTEAGRYDAAEKYLHESLVLAEACAMPYERALTLLARAELCAARGEQIEAMRLLDETRAICAPLGARPALARTDALAAHLAAAVPTRAPAYPAGLTAREVEVLRFVAQGLMNAEIADRLFLSERTIEQHLRSIYNKLGSSSRTAATRFAVEHSLA